MHRRCFRRAHASAGCWRAAQSRGVLAVLQTFAAGRPAISIIETMGASSLIFVEMIAQLLIDIGYVLAIC